MGRYKCDLTCEVFTEKNSLSSHERHTHGEKIVTNASYATKSRGERDICVDIRQVHTLYLLRCNAQNVRKRLRKQTIRKELNVNLFWNKKPGCLSDSKEAPSNDVTTEHPTNKNLVNMFPSEASLIDEPPDRKRCLKENFTKLVPDETTRV